MNPDHAVNIKGFLDERGYLKGEYDENARRSDLVRGR